jgi:hypothetical protein
MGELTAKLERLEHFLDQDGTSPALADITWSLAAELDLRQPVKLALVCADVEHLRRLLRTWRDSRGAAAGSRGPDDEVYFSAEALSHDGKIACVFPGMGLPGCACITPRSGRSSTASRTGATIRRTRSRPAPSSHRPRASRKTIAGG